MPTHPRPQSAAENIPCEVCHKEIPLASGKTIETEDYVAHFCGLECYATWKERGETERMRTAKKP